MSVSIFLIVKPLLPNQTFAIVEPDVLRGRRIVVIPDVFFVEQDFLIVGANV